MTSDNGKATISPLSGLTQEQLNQLAEVIRAEKPYIVALEEEIRKVQFGFIEVKLEIRGGVVEVMRIFETRNWVKEKEGKKV